MIGRIITLPIRLLLFGFWFGYQILRSTTLVLADILSPGHAAKPRVVWMPLGHCSDAHVTTISVLITLTPGTLTLGVSDQKGERGILVHSMYHSDEQEALVDLHDMDARLVRALNVREVV